MAMERSPDGLRYPCERCRAADSPGEVFCTGHSAAKPFRRLAGKPLRKSRITCSEPSPVSSSPGSSLRTATCQYRRDCSSCADGRSEQQDASQISVGCSHKVRGAGVSCFCPGSGHLPCHKVSMTATWETGIPQSSGAWGSPCLLCRDGRSRTPSYVL